MSSCYKIGRIALHVLSVLVLAAGVSLTAAGFFTPNWRTAELTQPSIERYLIGLFEDCVSGDKQINWICTYADFRGTPLHEHSSVPRHHPKNAAVKPIIHIHDREWRLAVLVLIVLSVFIGLVAICFSFCASRFRAAAILWSALTSLSGLCSIAGIGLFIKSVNEDQHKFVVGVNETAQQQLGYSFLLAVGGCVCFLLSSLLSIVTTICIFLGKQRFNDELAAIANELNNNNNSQWLPNARPNNNINNYNKPVIYHTRLTPPTVGPAEAGGYGSFPVSVLRSNSASSAKPGTLSLSPPSNGTASTKKIYD